MQRRWQPWEGPRTQEMHNTVLRSRARPRLSPIHTMWRQGWAISRSKTNSRSRLSLQRFAYPLLSLFPVLLSEFLSCFFFSSLLSADLVCSTIAFSSSPHFCIIIYEGKCLSERIYRQVCVRECASEYPGRSIAYWTGMALCCMRKVVYLACVCPPRFYEENSCLRRCD